MIRLSFLSAAISLAMWPCAVRADVFEIGAGVSNSMRPRADGVIEVGVEKALDIPEVMPEVPAAALSSIEPPVVPAEFQAPLTQAAEAARVSPTLLAALVWQESRWHPTAISPRGARGLTQLMPGTARALAVNPGDPAANLSGGARYLRTMLDRFDGNVERALAAYNAGPGRVMHSANLPAITETRAYVSAIIDRIGVSGATVLQGAKP